MLASPYVLVAAGVIYLVEFFADKIARVDSIWDGVHTFIRPLGASARAYRILQVHKNTDS